MSWDIDVIYTLPHPAIINVFRLIPEVGGVYLINDLQGITSEFERNWMLSDVPHPNSHMRHGLPESGLLATHSTIYRNIRDNTFIYTEKLPGTKSKHKTIEGLPSKLKFYKKQITLFSRLMSLNAKTKVPIMYYQCDMWGGLIDEEFAIVFNGEVSVYWRDNSRERTFLIRDEGDVEFETTPLQKGLEYLGLTLPSHYFALHSRNFDWARYWVKRENANDQASRS
jgi:hypothetical protein